MTKQQTILPIEGMTCASCVSTVERALNRVEGVDEANVNLATERASIKYSDDTVELTDLIQVVEETGYTVQVEKVTLPIGGMTCASCVAHVDGALRDTPGVLDVNVNLATEKATVTYVPGLVTLP